MSFCRFLVFVALGLAVLVTGCGSPTLSQRIAADREAFEEWPLEVQATVSEGQIGIGYSREQVRMAWGPPDHISMETTAEGRFERWVYERRTPAIGLGFGVGTSGRRTGIGGGVGTTVGGRTNVTAIARFQEGRVVSFERAEG